MSWKNTIQTIDKPSSWKDTIQDEVSPIESGLRGAAQGLTIGFSDEATGALEALWDKMSSDEKSKTFTDLYAKHRDESRNANKAAELQNPGSYLTGNIGGGIASALALPGSAATLAGRAAQAGALGATTGLGLSDSDSVSGNLKDAAIGGAIGAVSIPVIEGLGSLAKKGLKKTVDTIDHTILPKVGKGIFGVDEKATQNYLANSADVNKAYSMGDLADSVLNKTDDTSALNEMRQKVGNLANEHWNDLGRNTNLNKQDLLSLGDDFANKILKGKDGMLTRTQATGADADALKAIYKELDGIQTAYGDTLSEADLKSIVEGMQKKAFGSDTYSQEKMQQLSGVFNQALKSQNPAYAADVAKTADATNALKQVKSVFENRSNPESYDKFNKAVKNLINKDEMSSANQAVNKIQEHTGYDLRKDIVDSWTKSQFEKGDVNGSRKTLLGSMLGTAGGTALGNPLLGGALGSSVGYTADRYSGPLFKKLLDGRIKMDEFNQIAPQLGKFAKTLGESISRGPQAVAATHFVLQQTNPEYREKIQQINGEDQK